MTPNLLTTETKAHDKVKGNQRNPSPHQVEGRLLNMRFRLGHAARKLPMLPGCIYRNK